MTTTTRQEQVTKKANPTQGLKQGIQGLFVQVGSLFKAGNQRQFILRSAKDRNVFRLPLSFAVLILFFLLWQAAPLVIIAFIVALVTKMQFVIVKNNDEVIHDS